MMSLTSFFEGFSIDQFIEGSCVPTNTTILGFCRGSASVPRGFVSVEVGADDAGSQCDSEAVVVDSSKQSPIIGEQCDSLPHV